MTRYLFCIIFLGVILPNSASATSEREKLYEQSVQKSEELVSQAQSGKVGARDVMEQFATCAGFYGKLGEFLERFSKSPKAQNTVVEMQFQSRSSRKVAAHFWSPHSKKPMEDVSAEMNIAEERFDAKVREGRETFLEFSSTEMEVCKTLMVLQAKTLRVIDVNAEE